MTQLETKEELLKNAGYSYSFKRKLYLNRKIKQAFSVEFLEDHSPAEIESYLRKDAPSGNEWHFVFNDPPSAAVKSELTNLLG